MDFFPEKSRQVNSSWESFDGTFATLLGTFQQFFSGIWRLGC